MNNYDGSSVKYALQVCIECDYSVLNTMGNAQQNFKIRPLPSKS